MSKWRVLTSEPLLCAWFCPATGEGLSPIIIADARKKVVTVCAALLLPSAREKPDVCLVWSGSSCESTK